MKKEKNRSLKLHLGCGSQIRSGWINVDFSPLRNPDIVKVDLNKKWPFEENLFCAVYSCHMLEHISEMQAEKILLNIFKSLKRKGILRICVPDLEYSARLYINTLKKAKKAYASKHKRENYQWAFLNMIDQMIRTKPGGELKTFLQNCSENALKFAIQSTGGIEALTNRQFNYRKARTLRNFLSSIRDKIGIPSLRWKAEIHRFMYDEFNLCAKLAQAGFKKIKRKKAGDSKIVGFQKDHFEILPNGMERKPNSLIIESVKP